MAHSRCTGPGPGNDGNDITLCTVHTTQGQGQAKGILFSIVPTPFPVLIPIPVPIPCIVYKPLDR